MPDGKKLMLKGTNFHKVSTIGIRADALVPVKNGLGIIRGNVRVVERLGDVQYVHFTTDWGRDFVARFPPDKSVKVKSIIEFSISGKSHFFDSNGKVLRNVGKILSKIGSIFPRVWACLIPLLIILLRTYPLPSLEGVTPSAIKNDEDLK